MYDKIIVTNIRALREKYGAEYRKVHHAIKQLIAADKSRGVVTRLLAIDSIADMRRVRASHVSHGQNRRQVKTALDAIYDRYAPAYIMILGAPDVVPHQRLKNPARDEDLLVPTDLPYACAAPFSTDPHHFLGPTRVVGRLPDLEGQGDPDYLVKLLKVAAHYRIRDRSEFDRYLAVSARVWKKSTSRSLKLLFGGKPSLNVSPSAGPNWTPAQLASRIHFINCHGKRESINFFGQRVSRAHLVVAESSSKLAGKDCSGTVIAAECCYGAQIFSASHTHGQAGICSVYLAQGAYGFWGSTTVAYGPTEGNGQADFICQFFVDAVLKGASLGRAALEARQRFAALYSHVDTTDFKTLLQFNLLGDPAIHAVKPAEHAFSRTKAMRDAVKHGAIRPAERAFRRERLARTGSNLARTLGAALPAKIRMPPKIRRLLVTAARESGMRDLAHNAYRVSFPRTAGPIGIQGLADLRRHRAIHVISGKVGREQPTGISDFTLLIATTEHGKLVHLRRVHRR